MTPEISCLGGGQVGVAPSPWAGVLAALTVLGAHLCPVSLAPRGSLPLLLLPLNDLRIPVHLVYAHSFMPPVLFLGLDGCVIHYSVAGWPVSWHLVCVK